MNTAANTHLIRFAQLNLALADLKEGPDDTLFYRAAHTSIVEEMKHCLDSAERALGPVIAAIERTDNAR